jgi:hypothetical protein
VLGAAATSAPAPAPAQPTPARQDTLPFTGIDAWQLALMGCALLSAGLLTRRAAR